MADRNPAIHRPLNFAIGNRSVRIDNLEAITDPDEALALADAVAAELRREKAKPRPDQPRLQQLGKLHQAVLLRRRELKGRGKPKPPQPAPSPALVKATPPTEQEAPQAEPEPTAVPDLPLEVFFVRAAKTLLDPATFQRIWLTAETRRLAELSRRTGMALHIDDHAA